MSISIIIPTHNRAEILRKTLAGYAIQSGDHQMAEILVVDDGSTDDTAAVVEAYTSAAPVPIRYLRQKRSGTAAARNFAIREAKGDLVVLGDDDIVPGEDMVATHVAWHAKHPEPELALLGYVDWSPEVHPTPFMVWEGLFGPQFNFGYFRPENELAFGHTYFCNTSVKLRYLKEYGLFDESIKAYGWEDIELGYRLQKKGFRMFYSAEAVGYHFKHETFESALRRMESLYQSWPAFGKTEAGDHFLKLWKTRKAESRRGIKGMGKRVVKPIKSFLVTICKPLADTRVPLPHRLYEMMFYYYVTPFSEFITKFELLPSDDACSKADHAR